LYKDQLLENENRRKTYKLIESNPGIHLRELKRLSNLPLSTLNYHVNYMRRKKILVQEKDGGFSRFYTKPLDKEDKRLLKVLRQKKLRDIVSLVLINNKVKSKLLEDELGIPRSTLSLYLNCLLKNKVLVMEKIGYENIYSLISEDKIVKTLITYKSSLLDKIVDKTLNTWLDTRFGK
jgi:predicted transcriptional regulator